MKKRGINKKLAIVLSIFLCSSGCGRAGSDSASVDDYGPQSAQTDTIDENKMGDSIEESDEIVNTSDYGEYETVDVSLDWQDSLNVGNKEISCSVEFSKSVPVDELRKYTMNRAQDFSSSEEMILVALFGESYKKLDKLSFVNSTDYIPFLYKYRTLIDIFEKDDAVEFDIGIDQWIGNYKPIINGSFDEEYKWVDEDDYSIHMYEGTYNGQRFGLILASDKVRQTRYIYFKPISIDEYYPEERFKNVMLYNSTDIYGNVSSDNICTMTEEDAKEEARAFLIDFLGMKEEEASLGNDYRLYSIKSGVMLGAVMGLFMGDGPASEGASQLVFCDEDYIHALGSYTIDTSDADSMDSTSDCFPRSFELLAEQDDPAAEDMKDTSLNFVDYLISMRTSDMYSESANFKTDGYAFYLNPGFEYRFESNKGIQYFDNDLVNAGTIEITSNGIFGVDIIQMLDYENKEDETLASSDVIIDAAKNILEEDEFPDFMAEWESIQIDDVRLEQYVTEDTISVPAWKFILMDGDSGLKAELIINAVTSDFIGYKEVKESY